jgi:hypothetical protein
MAYPLRTVIRCVHDGVNMGSVVVVRGDPIYDENKVLTGYKNQFMQIRLGTLKGKDCRAFFDTLDDWHRSMDISYPVDTESIDYIDCLSSAGYVVVVLALVAALAQSVS